tara:strand:- start:164 stop:466 length:303 start_codon:yes stop_codon:yes gene_type:complete
MTETRNNHGNHNGQEKMSRAVRTRQERQAYWEKSGERPLWRNLSMIGALGWLVITPVLIGVLAGRWLDEKFSSGIFYTAALIFVGVAAGCYLAWQRVNKE